MSCMFEVLVGNGVGLGVAFGVDVGNGSEIALPEMVNIIISPSVIRSEPTEATVGLFDDIRTCGRWR